MLIIASDIYSQILTIIFNNDILICK